MKILRETRPATIRAALLVSTALALPGIAMAQAAGAGTTVETIVVTAEKRAADLQSVPLSIQALDTRKLEQLQITNFTDYVRFLPSVSQATGSAGVPGNSSASFRGIATDAGLITSGTLPTVGTYLDEQPVTTILGAPDIHVYDIARVEALAGPQGTLYGASAEAGVIRIITNKPDPSAFAASYDLSLTKVDGGGWGGSAEGYANIPLVQDRIALRTVGWYERRGGYISNVLHTRTFKSSKITQTNQGLLEDDANDTTIYGLRAALGIDIDDNWTATPSVIAQRTTWDGSFRSDTDKLGKLNVGHYFPEGGRDAWVQAGLTITGRISDFEVTYSGNYMHRTASSQNDYSDYGFYYDAIAGSGAYVKNNAGQLIDPSQWNINRDVYRKVSQELRVASPQVGKVRGIAGLFYQRQSQNDENDYLTPGFADRLSIPGRPGQVWLTKEKRIDRDYAIFGQVDIDVTDKLTVTGGVRGYRFNNSLVGFYGVNTTFFGTGVRQCLGPKTGPYGLGVAVVAGSPCTNLGILEPDGTISPKRSKGSGTTWRLNGNYKIDPDHLVYATASTGFRPGGINRAGVGAPFDADKLTNYEIGTKNTLFDRRMTLNATVFWEDWKDVQVTYQAPGGSGVALIANAGKARSRGVEGDFSWRVTPGFTLSGAATYVDAKLQTPLFTGGTVPRAPKGQRLPLTSKFKGNLVGRYNFALGDMDAHVQLAAAYIGKRNPVISTADLAKLGQLPSYVQVDATAGIVKDAYSVEVFVQNLADARGQISRAAECNINYCGPSTFDPVGEIYRVYIQPRTFGIRFGQKF